VRHWPPNTIVRGHLSGLAIYELGRYGGKTVHLMDDGRYVLNSIASTADCVTVYDRAGRGDER